MLDPFWSAGVFEFVRFTSYWIHRQIRPENKSGDPRDLHKPPGAPEQTKIWQCMTEVGYILDNAWLEVFIACIIVGHWLHLGECMAASIHLRHFGTQCQTPASSPGTKPS